MYSIFKILTLKEKKQILVILFIAIVVSILDMVSVASIMPFVAILSDSEVIKTNDTLKYFYNASLFYGTKDTNDFIFFFGLLIVSLLIITIFFRALLSILQTRFNLLTEYNLSSRLIDIYLNQPYNYFVNSNSSEIGKNILSEVNTVIKGIFVPCIAIFSQGMVVIMLASLVFYSNPSIAINVSLILIASYLIIFFVVKNLLLKIGNSRLEMNGRRFNILYETFGSIKEIKLRGIENIFKKNFDNVAEIFAKNSLLAIIISSLPRYFLELIAFCGSILLVLLLLKQNMDFTKIAPIIALYIFAAYRLLPAIQQVYSSASTIQFSKPSLTSLINKFDSLKKNIPNDIKAIGNSRINFTNSINLKNVSFNYSNTRYATIKNINIKINAFSKVGIVGHTGSGKTTVLDVILGLLEKDSGKIFVDEQEITNRNVRLLQNNIGYVPQSIYLSDSSITSNIAFGIPNNLIDFEIVERVSKIANIHDFIMNDLPDNYKTIVGERGVRLSGGQKQRIGIARALYNNPAILILDEATSALDSINEDKIMKTLTSIKNKMTIIIVTHRLNTVKDCDMIYFLERGQIVDNGKFEDLILRNHKFKSFNQI
jgi:ABC-type multidrug transport system fused ATPase/permease subunit